MDRRAFIVKAAAFVAFGRFIKPAVQAAAAPAPFEMKLVSTPIVAQARKLKAVWTCECEQDLQAWYGIDAERAMTDVLRFYDSRQRG
jgi:hypothetical protein